MEAGGIYIDGGEMLDSIKYAIVPSMTRIPRNSQFLLSLAFFWIKYRR